MIKKKKTPERKCLGCSESKDKRELVRIVRTPEGNIEVDLTGKKSGRGCYICNNADCFKAARKAKRIERSLQTEIPDEVYENLLKIISGEENL